MPLFCDIFFKGYLVNQAETFDSAEELEIQRQQSEYSGFGDKIPENGENIIPQQQDRVPTENPYLTSLGEDEATDSHSSLDPLSEDQAIRIVPVKVYINILDYMYQQYCVGVEIHIFDHFFLKLPIGDCSRKTSHDNLSSRK